MATRSNELAEDEAIAACAAAKVEHVEAVQIIWGQAKTTPVIFANNIRVNIGKSSCDSRRQGGSGVAACACFQICSARERLPIILRNFLFHEKNVGRLMLHGE